MRGIVDFALIPICAYSSKRVCQGAQLAVRLSRPRPIFIGYLSLSHATSAMPRALAARQARDHLVDGTRALRASADPGRRAAARIGVARLTLRCAPVGNFRYSNTPYSMIFATTPAPTVRPPSRIAKRKPSSIAIGAISVATICTLSPGITISTPSGSSTAPVTSVVRK